MHKRKKKYLSKEQTAHTQNNNLHNEIRDNNRLGYRSRYLVIQNRIKTVFKDVKIW